MGNLPSLLAGAIASNMWTTSGSSLSPHIGENSGASLSASNLKRRFNAGTVTFRLHFVSAGYVGPEGLKVVKAKNHTNPDYVKIWDIDALGPAIDAFNALAPAVNRVSVPVARDDRLVVEAGDYRASVAAVRANDIVKWPGIEDRTLFNLNVRRQLPANKVRSALDRAINQPQYHDQFLASHNGITVVCRRLETSDDEIVMHDPSVVNGAQSIIAFFDNRETLTDYLRVFVKICELDPAGPFARDIAIRSNTQSAVNSRNLRALDGPQLRLQSGVRSAFSRCHLRDASRCDPDSGGLGHRESSGREVPVRGHESPPLVSSQELVTIRGAKLR